MTLDASPPCNVCGQRYAYWVDLGEGSPCPRMDCEGRLETPEDTEIRVTLEPPYRRLPL